jgi:hypothetical protein
MRPRDIYVLFSATLTLDAHAPPSAFCTLEQPALILGGGGSDADLPKTASNSKLQKGLFNNSIELLNRSLLLNHHGSFFSVRR